jgi:hypothetical protein
MAPSRSKRSVIVMSSAQLRALEEYIEAAQSAVIEAWETAV